MDLKTFLSGMSNDERDDFAQKCGTSRGHLQNIMHRVKTCSGDLAVQVEFHSLAQVTVEELCPTRPWMRLRDKAWPHSGGRPVLDPASAVEREAA